MSEEVSLLREIRDILRVQLQHLTDVIHEDNLQKLKVIDEVKGKDIIKPIPIIKPISKALTVMDVKAKFSPEIAEQLTVEETTDYLIVKPKTWLGKEVFNDVRKLLESFIDDPDKKREIYVSAGKDSHFKISRRQ